MSNFLLHDKNFESTKADIPGTNRVYELLNMGKDEYCLLEHEGDSVGEIASFTKKELFVLWKMLTIEK